MKKIGDPRFFGEMEHFRHSSPLWSDGEQQHKVSKLLKTVIDLFDSNTQSISKLFFWVFLEFTEVCDFRC